MLPVGNIPEVTAR